jgi:hypothetical protein
MRLLQLRDLRALADVRQWPCISIYLPTHRTGQGTRENPIRLRNAVGKARDRLLEAGFPKDATTDLLAAAGNLLTSRDFWLHPADGLALFIARDVFQYHQVPLPLRDDVVLADHFSLRPLIPLFAGDGRFYLLAFSQKHVRFFEATRTGMQERAVPEMLKSIDDLRQYEEVEDHVAGHTVSVPRGGRADLMFHGQGNIADKTTYKANVLQYLQIISRRLEKYLDAETAPLVLAAVDYELSFYREVNSYQYLLEEGIAGNPDEANEEDLHRAAWKIVAPYFARAKETSLEHFADLSGTDKTSVRVEEILPAACRGQVRTLFVRLDARLWGKFDPTSLRVTVHESAEAGDTDLIDLTTICVLQSKGTIYTLPQEEMPTESLQAALLRYAPG